MREIVAMFGQAAVAFLLEEEDKSVGVSFIVIDPGKGFSVQTINFIEKSLKEAVTTLRSKFHPDAADKVSFFELKSPDLPEKIEI